MFHHSKHFGGSVPLPRVHFEYPNGLHANEYMQTALAMRNYQIAKTLSVGLSRLLRAHAEIRAMIPELSVVCPDTGGSPVAYGVCEALRAHQFFRLLVRLIPDRAVQHHLGAVAFRRGDLRRRRVLGHAHDGANSVNLRGQCDTLSVIPRR